VGQSIPVSKTQNAFPRGEVRKVKIEITATMLVKIKAARRKRSRSCAFR